MARNSFFDLTLALEEDTSGIIEEASANATENPIEVSDVVDAEDNTEEIVELQADAEDKVESVLDAQEATDELSDQVEEQEAIIAEKPEEVTEDTVAVAQEAFFITLARLRLPYEEIRAHRISIESSDSTPLQKLQVSCEGIKDMLKKIGDGIVKAIKAIINTIKKLFQNAVIFFDRSAKTIDALITKYKNSGSAKINVNDNIIKKVNGYFGGWFLATGDYNFGEMVEYASAIKLDSTVVSAIKQDMAKKAEAAASSESYYLSREGIVAKAAAFLGFGKAVENQAKKTKGGKDMVKGDSLNDKIIAIANDAENLKNVQAVVYLYGSKITAFTGNDLKSSSLDLSKINENDSRTKLNALTVSGIIGDLGKIKTKASDMKKYQQETFKSLDDIVSEAQKASTADVKEDDAEGKEKATFARKKLQLLQKIGTKFALESVNQYIGYIKGSVSSASALLATTDGKED